MKASSALLVALVWTLFGSAPAVAEIDFDALWAGEAAHQADGKNTQCRLSLEVKQTRDSLYIGPRVYHCGPEIHYRDAIDLRMDGNRLFYRNGTFAGTFQGAQQVIIAPQMPGNQPPPEIIGLLPAAIEDGVVTVAVLFEVLRAPDGKQTLFNAGMDRR